MNSSIPFEILPGGSNITVNVSVLQTDNPVSSVFIIIWDTIKGGTEYFRGLLTLIEDYWTLDVVINESFGGKLVNFTIYSNDSTNSTSMLDGNFSSNSVMVVNLNRPEQNNNTINFNNIIFNCSAAGYGLTLDNITLWHDLNGLFISNGTTDISGTTNSSQWTRNLSDFLPVKTLIDRPYIYNCEAKSTDNVRAVNSTNFTFTNWDLGQHNNTFVNLTTGYVDIVGTNISAYYNSSVRDMGTTVFWSNLSWGYGGTEVNISLAACDDINCVDDPFTLTCTNFAYCDISSLLPSQYLMYKVNFNDTDQEFHNITIKYGSLQSVNNVTAYNESGAVVNATVPFERGDNITFNVSVTPGDNDISSVFVIIWQTIKGGAEFFRGFLTLVEGYYTLSVDTNVSFTGLVNYTIYINDSSNNTIEFDGNFTSSNFAPTHDTPILNSTSGNNLSSDNLTVYNISTFDTNDDDTVKNIINWKLNGTSLHVLNMPFENGSTDSIIVKDYSGYSFDGSVKNGAVFNRTGGYDGYGAFEFDGVDDYINVTNTQTGINFSNMGEFTVMAWIKTKNLAGPDGDGEIVSKYYSTSDDRSWTLQIRDHNARFIACADGTIGSCVYATGTTEIPNMSAWYHVAGTWNGTAIQVYVNGVGDDATPPALTSLYDTQIRPIAIAKSVAAQAYFNGSIDEVMIYNKSLSENQILAIYQNRTDLILSSETSPDENWTACITPNDGYGDGIEKCSNNITILQGNNYPNCTGDTDFGNWIISDTQTITDNLICNSVYITSTGQLRVDTATKGSYIQIQAANLTIEDGGSMNTSEYGYIATTGPGQGTDASNSGGGGGYGAVGGISSQSAAGGTHYGDALIPTELGSGGGNGTGGGLAAGGSGGGAVYINISDILYLNGTIVANGETGESKLGRGGGGGSGGSIFVNTSTLKGFGNFTARGGNGGDQADDGGGGSGGRIVVYFNTIQDITYDESKVTGGTGPGIATDGAPGTLAFINKNYNTLTVSEGWEFTQNANYENITIYSATIRLNQSVQFNATDFVRMDGVSITCYSTSYDFNMTIANTLNLTNVNIKNSGNGGVDCDDVYLYGDDFLANSTTIEANGSVLLNRSQLTSKIYDALSITASNNITLKLSGQSLTFVSSTLTTSNIMQYADVNNPNILNLQSTAVNANVNWSVLNLSVDSSSNFSVDAKGYPATTGPGQGGDAANGAGGAGHGGDGGASVSAAGSAYGSMLAPRNFGSGGGNATTPNPDKAGGYGGGLVILNVNDSFEFNGEINVNGGNGYGALGWSSGGGSGGSIYIKADNFSGAGNLSAYGGMGGNQAIDSGGGAGGRIAIFYGVGTHTGSVNVSGGLGPDFAAEGGNGTIFRCSNKTLYSCGINSADGTNVTATFGGVTVNTLYSINKSVNVNKTIKENWTNAYVVWNDSSSISTNNATYVLTGLLASTDFIVKNNSVEIGDSPLSSDGSGELPSYLIA
ncbi:MAG: LamG domain-containing protein, partial [Bacteroidetes bacterium]|nr:LamG domain-containing protein [Bacteroidota bacterium]